MLRCWVAWVGLDGGLGVSVRGSSTDWFRKLCWGVSACWLEAAGLRDGGWLLEKVLGKANTCPGC